MLVFHGLLSAKTTSILMFKNCILLGSVMVHGIILQYSRNCMYIHSKNIQPWNKDSYDLMCAIDEYENQNPPIEPDDERSGGGRHLSST